MRLTRAAQRAQEGTEATADHDHDQAALTDNTDRAALNEISANASPEQDQHEEDLPKKTPAKTPAKKGKKGGAKKGAKGKKAKNTEEQQEEESVQEAVQDAPAEVVASVVDAAVDGSAKEPTNNEVEVPKDDQRPATPPVAPVRLTRRQLAAMQEEEKLKQSQCAPSPEQEPETTKETVTSVEDATTGAQEIVAEDTQEKGTSEPEAPQDQEVAVSPVLEAAPESLQEELMQEPQVVPETVQDEVIKELEPVRNVEIEVAIQPEQIVPMPIEADDEVQESTELAPTTESDAQESTATTPSVEVTSDTATPKKSDDTEISHSDTSVEPKTLATEKPSEQAMSPESYTSSRRRASRSPSKSPMRIEESFEAIDALEEALDSLDAVTSFNRPIEEKSPRKKALAALTENSEVRAKTPSKAPNKTTVAPTRISRVPSAIPTGMKATKTSLARASSVRAASTREVKTGPTETVDYLASKRRPISVSFPTPPPPPKGRAPTKATFQLSSNDVVAKLKAQKEERAKREAEGVLPKQRPISMPPPPKSSKPLTKPTFQLPGEKTAEKLKVQKEERLKKQAEAPRHSLARPVSISIPAPSAPAKSIKPPTKPTNFQLPGAAVAEKLKAQKEERLKRQEEAEAARKEAAALKPRIAPVARKPVMTLPVRSTSGVTIPPPSTSHIQAPTQRSTSTSTDPSTANKRNSIAPSQSRSTSTSSTSANRNSIIVAKTTVTPTDAAVQRVKGKEVFNRNKMEKEERERERTDKENAAKKARADAAERGRIASREWAEKQRKKMMAV
ncbi:hypothetical protein T440DRAFT_453414 [Plenodomus tracheiphilus IPT5]|uniref:Uncharacterized protein n=1 Tax=Plenodomus tracheiphilus IPT5 TaxID=1408161 RepID=A0A6A7B0E6_9PLEO|nr:hypothetical protein T440DRAFT_453414 [Plenodomus tracheiphilus IPT5]